MRLFLYWKTDKEKMSRIKVIKKNDEYSLEYEIGDIFEVTGTWYGGVHINGRSGIPVSLDREEYRELEDGAKEQENEDESREAKPQARQGASVSEETIEKIRRFRDERDWRQFHNPKDLAISISLEAAELLEVFQWSAGDVYCREKTDKIREELADVLLYCMLMADACGLDPDAIMQEKLKRNEEKYPVELAKGSREKYDQLKG